MVDIILPSHAEYRLFLSGLSDDFVFEALSLDVRIAFAARTFAPLRFLGQFSVDLVASNSVDALVAQTNGRARLVPARKAFLGSCFSNLDEPGQIH